MKKKEKKFGNPGNKNGMYGKTHTPETKQKLSTAASQKTGSKNPFYGKEHSEETKKKIAEKNKGKIPGNAIRISINNKEYSSYHEASCDLDIPHTTIRWRCLSENKKFKDYKILS